MIKLIAKKEFRTNILTFRLLIGLIVCVLLMLSSTYVLTRDFEKRLRDYDVAVRQHADELKKVKVYSQLELVVEKPPEPLSIFCRGMEGQLGNSVTISYKEVPVTASVRGGGNPLMNVFSSVDVVLVVSTVFSLFTLLISYDTISGEREKGTLALVMSNSISKYHFLVGKYLGGMASLVLPLFIGWLGTLAIMQFSSAIEFDATTWTKLGLLLLYALIYLSLFFMLGMLISAKVKRSSTALFSLLFLWILIVFIIPNSVAYLAGQIRPIESKTKIDAESKLVMNEYWQKVRDYSKEHQSGSYTRSGYSVYSGISPIAFSVLTGSMEAMLWTLDGTKFYVPLRIKYAERIGELYKQYHRSLLNQTALAGSLSRLSPAWIYYNVSSVLVGTDLESHERFVERARNYRKEVLNYMQSEDVLTSLKWFTQAELDKLPSQAELNKLKEEYITPVEEEIKKRGKMTPELRDKLDQTYRDYYRVRDELLSPRSWDDVKPVDLSNMPRFDFRQSTLPANIRRSIPGLTVLILLNVLLFYGTAAIFIKSEVKRET